MVDEEKKGDVLDEKNRSAKITTDDKGVEVTARDEKTGREIKWKLDNQGNVLVDEEKTNPTIKE